MKIPQHPLDKYLRKEAPIIRFCSGCGEAIVVFNTMRVIESLGINRDRVAIVIGIGCHAGFRDILDFDVASTLHGRAIPFATGLKLQNPGLEVIAFVGDGDGASIGGNHLIHAARRNIDITVILMNNWTYANTGGQASCVTPYGSYTTTTPYGNIERPFDICELVKSAGANYVARWTTFHVKRSMKSLKEAIGKRGFSFIEYLCQCPVRYGRQNRMLTPVDMLEWYKENCVAIEKARKISEEELEGKCVIGKFADRDLGSFVDAYSELRKHVQEG